MAVPGAWGVSTPTLPITPDVSTGPSHPLDLQDAQSYLMSQMLARRAEYTRPHTLRIKVGSWNVAAVADTEKELSDWLVKGGEVLEDGIDIYVLGLQEVVDVNQTQNFIRYMDPKIALNWRAHAQVPISPRRCARRR